MRILDLYCCAGGAARGYAMAGYSCVGVDLDEYEDYPFPGVAASALDVLDTLLDGGSVLGHTLADFDAAHSSPPCQKWAPLMSCRPGGRDSYLDLIAPTRERLIATGLPYVIENVPQAPLKDPVILCGTQFGKRFKLHRAFETNWPLPQPECDHSIRPFNPENNEGRKQIRAAFPEGTSVWASFCAEKGLTGPGGMRYNGDYKKQAREAISPYFTEFIGRSLAAHLLTGMGI